MGGKKAGGADDQVAEEDQGIGDDGSSGGDAAGQGRLLEGDFAWPDGSEYSGQYLVKSDRPVLHGRGRLQMGPEVFSGTFDCGLYKEGSFTGADGSVFKGGFHNNVFHGPGEFTWADGRFYRGMWEQGQMHGRGEFHNFSFGVDTVFHGISVCGSFNSSLEGQQRARAEFVAEYGPPYTSAACAVLQDLASRACPAEPSDPKAKKSGGADDALADVPKEFLVLPAADQTPEEGGAEGADPTPAPDGVAGFVNGSFPDCAGLKASALLAFASRFADGAEQPGNMLVLDSNCAECVVGNFSGTRLQRQQLEHAGQAVAFTVGDAEAGAVCAMVFVNVGGGFDAADARWKLVHLEEAPQPQPA